MKKTGSWLIGNIIGIGISIGLILLITGIISRLLVAGQLESDSTKWVLALGFMIAVYIGNRISIQNNPGKRFAITAVNTLNMILILIIGSLLISGPYDGIILRIVSILSGGIVSYLTIGKKTSKSKAKKLRSR